MLQGNWDFAVNWVQVPGAEEAKAAHCRNVESEASVVVRSGSNIEAISCMWHPGRLLSWIVLYQGSSC
jgi:hypothetical protein